MNDKDRDTMIFRVMIVILLALIGIAVYDIEFDMDALTSYTIPNH